MTAILTRLNMGLMKGSLEAEEIKAVDQVLADLASLKEPFLEAIAGGKPDLDVLFDEKVKSIRGVLEPFGPFLEAPSLRHTESNGSCSIYTEREGNEDFTQLFTQALTHLGGVMPSVEGLDQIWRPEQEVRISAGI